MANRPQNQKIIINGGGVLLTTRPDLFLRFYRWQNPGDYWGRDWAGRQKDIDSNQYKFLGIMFVAVGLFPLRLSRQTTIVGATPIFKLRHYLVVRSIDFCFDIPEPSERKVPR